MAENDDVDPDQTVVDIINAIQKLHSVVAREITTDQELRDAHQEQVRYHQRRVRGRSDTPAAGVDTTVTTAATNHSYCSLNRVSFLYGCSLIIFVCVATPLVNKTFEHILGMRCFVPNNYLVWEATRPKSDCSFCRGIDQPIVLANMSRDEFSPYAYSSAPIIIKNAVSHWPAVRQLNYTYLKDLYLRTPGALESVNEDCQFLHFKSNFMTLAQVFEMPKARAEMMAGEMPWYVGWSNCNPAVLAELRKLYPRPHFLPADAEMPNTDFIFLGWEQGAVMHLDYIPRLMWQAQLRGRKHWMLAPTPECDSECKSFAFFVEAGDAILVDTRLWYHGTHVTSGEFSLTIQSEYG